MADFLVLENLKPYDGRYLLDLEGSPFTIREWGWLKRLSGYLPGNAAGGYEEGDPELQLVIALILLRRNGQLEAVDVPATFERLADKPAASIRWENDGAAEVAEDADPTASSPEKLTYSGDDSSESSTSSGTTPLPTGLPESDSSPSVRAISGS